MSYMPKPKENKRLIGSEYEKIAAVYLTEKGYTILEMNYRCKLGEIDIIAKDHEYIVFIEVKYRKDKQYGLPREAVNYYKKNRIIKVATYYMRTRYDYERSCRFDVIDILGSEMTHLEAAF